MINVAVPENCDFDIDFEFDFGFQGKEKRELFKAKDPISALTHFIGFEGALLGMPVLLIKASISGMNLSGMISLAVFMVSMVMLYGASTAYHTFRVSPVKNKVLKKIDHMMIFMLIAGSYTPMCTIVLQGGTGNRLLALIWTIAALGILFKAFWVTCPKWISSVIYITMGWAALLAFGEIYSNMATGGFILLVVGGVLYSVGGIVYALKIQNLVPGFGAHELFHLFVLAGSLCHYIMMLLFVA